MKKLIFILTILLSVSCEKEEEYIGAYNPMAGECYEDDVICSGVYKVKIVYNYDDIPDELIIAEKGYSAKLGELLSFKGTSAPGYKFIGWRKVRNSYCSYSPLVDEDDPTVAYVYMHRNYMGNCNIGPFNVKIVAEYIKTLD